MNFYHLPHTPSSCPGTLLQCKFIKALVSDTNTKLQHLSCWFPQAFWFCSSPSHNLSLKTFFQHECDGLSIRYKKIANYPKSQKIISKFFLAPYYLAKWVLNFLKTCQAVVTNLRCGEIQHNSELPRFPCLMFCQNGVIDSSSVVLAQAYKKKLKVWDTRNRRWGQYNSGALTKKKNCSHFCTKADQATENVFLNMSAATVYDSQLQNDNNIQATALRV